MRAILVVLAIILAGCSQAEPEAEPVLEADLGQGVIRGLVVDSAITPLEGVTILLADHDVTAYTDADGEFSFSNVDAGVYRLVVSLYGYLDQQATVTVEPGILDPERVQVELVRLPGTEPLAVPAKHDARIGCEVIVLYALQSCDPGNVGLESDNAFLMRVDDRIPRAVHVELGWSPNQEVGKSLTLNYGTCTGNEYCDPKPPADTFLCQTFGESPLWCRVTQTGVERSGSGSAAATILHTGHGTKANSAIAVHVGADCAVCLPAPYQEWGLGAVAEQGVETFLWSFYNFEPPTGWSFIRDGAPEVPA